MQQIAYMALIVFCLVFQVAVLGEMRALDAAPNLLFIVALYAALFAPRPDAVITAWIAGFACDIFAGGRLGVYSFLFAAFAALVVRAREKVFSRHFLSQAALALAGCALAESAAVAALKAQYPDADTAALWPGVLVTSVWTAALAPFVIALLARLNRLLGFVQKRSLANA